MLQAVPNFISKSAILKTKGKKSKISKLHTNLVKRLHFNCFLLVQVACSQSLIGGCHKVKYLVNELWSTLENPPIEGSKNLLYKQTMVHTSSGIGSYFCHFYVTFSDFKTYWKILFCPAGSCRFHQNFWGHWWFNWFSTTIELVTEEGPILIAMQILMGRFKFTDSEHLKIYIFLTNSIRGICQGLKTFFTLILSH